MKKLFYIVLIIVILLVAAHFVKQHNANKYIPENEVVTISVDEDGNVISEEDYIYTDENASDSLDNLIEEVEEDIVEENPDATADDHETVIEE